MRVFELHLFRQSRATHYLLHIIVRDLNPLQTLYVGLTIILVGIITRMHVTLFIPLNERVPYVQFLGAAKK